MPLGPYGASVDAIASSPAEPGTVFAGTTGGLFRSEDGMATWQAVGITPSTQPAVRAIWIDPRDPQTVVVATDYILFRSTDGGASWQRSQMELPLSEPEDPVCLAGDPSSPGTLYACSANPVFDFGQGVLKSTDGGATFRPTGPQLGTADVTSLLLVPGSPAVLYAAVLDTWGNGSNAPPSPTGVLMSSDGGATWKPRNKGLVLPAGQPGAFELARDARTGTLFVLVAATGAVFASHDGAVSWEKLATPAAAVAIATKAGGIGDTLFLSSAPEPDGVPGVRLYASTDDGASWSLTAAPVPATILSPQPTLPGVFAAANGGLVISDDGGASWRLSRRGLGDLPGTPLAVSRGDGALYAQWGERFDRRRAGAWSLLPGSAYQVQVAVDPADPQHLFTVERARLKRSTDGGVTRRFVSLPNACVEVATVAFSPADPRVVYAGGIPPEGHGPGHHPDPDPSCLRKCQAWRSDDRGETWSCLPLDNVFSFVADPRRSRVVYAIGDFSTTFPYLGYIAKSVDGGRTWKNASTGLNQLGGFVDDTRLLTIDPAAPARLFTFVELGPGQQLFASDNGGASWKPLGQPLSGVGETVLSLLLAGTGPDVFYVGTTTDGVLRSADGGTTWTPLAPGIPQVQLDGSLVANPTQPQVFYAGTHQRGVMVLRRSTP